MTITQLIIFEVFDLIVIKNETNSNCVKIRFFVLIFRMEKLFFARTYIPIATICFLSDLPFKNINSEHTICNQIYFNGNPFITNISRYLRRRITFLDTKIYIY